VKIPVIAAGGIYDARGAVAAFALGAEGIQMGTRFVATEECNAHENFKKAIVNSADIDTVVTGRKIGITRILKGPVASRLLDMESKGATPDELLGYIGGGRSRKGQFFGDLNEGEAYCGAIAGAIKEVKKAGDIIREMAAGYDQIKSGL
jgi:NAD(P)H-dependent flavin oxidoreductase YrpB (nitropropane dioxygenase family)